MDRITTALSATGYKYAHFAWNHAPNSTYLVYAEDEAIPLRADEHQAERIMHGTIDCFTRDDSGAPLTTVESQLNTIDNFSFKLNSIQFEEETGLIHYEWEWSLA